VVEQEHDMAGLLDRRGVVGLLGPTKLDPFADSDGLDRRAFDDMIALRRHLAEMLPYEIVEDANGTRHLVRREPIDGPPSVRLAGPDTLPMIDAGAPPRMAGLPMLGDSDAMPNAVWPRPVQFNQACARAPQERAPSASSSAAPDANPPAAAPDDEPADKASRAQPPQVAPEAAASPGPPSGFADTLADAKREFAAAWRAWRAKTGRN
jgi:hypothetical protein